MKENKNTSDKKTILIFANKDSGLYNFRGELLKRLIELGNRVVISLPEGDRIPDLINLGCEYIKTEVSRRGTNPIEDVSLFFKYINILKKIKPNVVLTYTIKPNVYGGIACELTKTPYIENITGLGSAVENGGFLQKLTLLLYKIAVKKAKCVFFQNTENMKFFCDKKIVAGRYNLLPGSGVNLEKFLPMEYPKGDIVKFVFIARIMKEKGIDEYIECANYIKKKYQNTEFHICGFCEDEYKDKMQTLTENKNVIYHGVVSDMRTVLKDMHCVIHPSYYPEGMSNVLLEGAAMAKPLITTDRPGCREIIDDGINGYICRQKDSKNLIDKVEKFLILSYEEKKEMGIQGRKKVEKEFDRNIVIKKYLKEIKNI